MSEPHCHISMTLNLKARAATNHMAKYADDATLLVPEMTSLSIEEEFRFVQKWACDNKLSINCQRLRRLFSIGPIPDQY